MNYNSYLKVALASPVVHLGRPMLNAKEIIQILNKDTKSSIICFPEMSLTGCNIGDLVFNNGFLNEVIEALNYVVENSSHKILLIGLPLLVDGAIYNCCCAIQNKEILGIIPKVNLQDSGVLNESRYFKSGFDFINNFKLINILGKDVPFGQIIFNVVNNNIKFGVEISNDIDCLIPPHTYLYSSGADFVINLSSCVFSVSAHKNLLNKVNIVASKYHGGYLLVSNNTSETSSDIIYSTNQIASVCDETICDIEELLLEEVINYVDIDLEFIRFEKSKKNINMNLVDTIDCVLEIDLNIEKLENYNLEVLPNKLPFVPNVDNEFEKIIDATTCCLKHRLDHIGINKVVIGISGGLDSTLALMFAYSTFKRFNMDLKNIIGITMPGMGTGSKSKTIAKNLMEKLGITSKEVSIKKEALQHLKLIGHNLETKDITYENVQARLRTLVLMSTANLEKAIVIGTGDMSEIALGWSTYGGDQLSMYSLNSGLPKTTIKALVDYYSKKYTDVKYELKKVYNATISPELTGSDQATEDKIGKYEINDFIMYHLFKKGASKLRIVYLLNKVFNLNNDVSIKYYDEFMRRFNTNQFKRLTGAEGIKIFDISLSPRSDLKYPGDIK